MIIDGYNFIGFHKGLSKKLEAQRNQLISILGSYRQNKNFPICVVFDGWKDGELHQHFEIKNGIEVVYSRLGEKADQVIIRFIKRLKEQCVVVSSDREIRDCAHQYGATALTIQEFNSRLSHRDSGLDEEMQKEEEDKSHRFGKKSGNPKKLPKRERAKQNKLRKL